MVASADNQACEPMSNQEQEQSASFVGIDPGKTYGSAKWQLPGMRKALFHWQWHAVFTLALMNTGRDDLYGGLLGDEMGLGKVR